MAEKQENWKKENTKKTTAAAAVTFDDSDLKMFNAEKKKLIKEDFGASKEEEGTRVEVQKSSQKQKEQLLKSLFVSTETLSTAQDGIVNGLALAFNVWLEDADNIFDDRNFPESD